MRDRDHLYRRNDDIADLRTEKSPYTWHDAIMALLAVALIVAVYAVAMHSDDQAAEAEALARSEHTRLALPNNLREAYERGMSDMLETLQDSPGGVALAQACLARGARK